MPGYPNSLILSLWHLPLPCQAPSAFLTTWHFLNHTSRLLATRCLFFSSASIDLHLSLHLRSHRDAKTFLLFT